MLAAGRCIKGSNVSIHVYEVFLSAFVCIHASTHDIIYERFKDASEYLLEACELDNMHLIRVIKNYDITFNKIPFKKNNYVIKVLPNGCTAVFIDMHMLNNIVILNNMLCELKINIVISSLTHTNIGTLKFYSNEYKVLSKTLRDEKYYDSEYYDFLNDNYEIIL